MATMLMYKKGMTPANDRKTKKQMTNERHYQWAELYDDLLALRIQVYGVFDRPEAKRVIKAFKLNEYLIAVHNGDRADDLYNLVVKEMATVKELCIVDN